MIDLASIDLSTLKAGPTGHQNDPGVGGPGSFRLVRVVPILIVERADKPGDEFAVDPVHLAFGEFEAHDQYLICQKVNGKFLITDKESAIAVLTEAASWKLQQGAARVAMELTALIGSEAAPAKILGLLKTLLGL